MDPEDRARCCECPGALVGCLKMGKGTKNAGCGTRGRGKQVGRQRRREEQAAVRGACGARAPGASPEYLTPTGPAASGEQPEGALTVFTAVAEQLASDRGRLRAEGHKRVSAHN